MAKKEANKKYIVDEEIEFLGKPVGEDFVEPEKQVAGYESVNVELLTATDYEQWVNGALYASLCTWDTTPHLPATELLNAPFKEKEERLFYILKQRPISVALEGSIFIFKCTGIPRALTHQIVRARQMAFGQQSYRVSSCYSDPVRIPDSIKDDVLYNEYIETVKHCRSTYKKLIESGVPMENARCIMPMGTCTKITITMRLRDLLEYVKGRTSAIAQDEHTYFVCKLLEELKSKQPKYFDLVVSRTPGIEETMRTYLK